MLTLQGTIFAARICVARKIVLELIGVFLVAGSVVSVAVLSRLHRPYEIRSPNPLDFELTAVDAYHRMFSFLSAGKIGTHTWTVKETVDPLYIIAQINYHDVHGNRCDSDVTFDVVEGYKSTTTIRWSCKFLKWCDKATAESMEKLLDSWVESCLIPELTVPPSAMPTSLLKSFTAKGTDHPATDDKQARSLKETLSPVQDLIVKSISKPLKTGSPDALTFDLQLEKAFSKVHEVMAANNIDAYKWTIKEEIEHAYIISQLSFREVKPKFNCDVIVNFDFTSPKPDVVSIIWSCEFVQWFDNTVATRMEQAINAWLNVVLAIPTEPLSPAETNTVSSDGGVKQFSFSEPLKSSIESGYPREFAYIKIMQRLTAKNDLYTKWNLEECVEGSLISARVMHQSSKKKGTFCTANVSFEFTDNNEGSNIACTYRFNPDSDIEVLQDFTELTGEWLRLVVRR